MLNNPILTNPTDAVDLDTAVYACTVCGSTTDWIDASDNLWHCTACSTAHAWPIEFAD